MANSHLNTEVYKKHDNYSRRLLIVPGSYPRRLDTTAKEGDKLSIALHDYRVHNASSDALTLLFTHGTSFNKDLWDIIIDHLIGRKELHGRIKRIIAIDAATHGDSAIANEGKLGEKAYWPDNAYDILTVIESLGLSDPIVGIGHSFGGGALAHAALISPSTFAMTIFVDPIAFVMEPQDQMAADGALRRRDQWPSLAEVRSAFEKSKGLADWHPEQRAIYAEKGTYDKLDTQNGKVSRVLKTPKVLEAATYIAAPLPDLIELFHQSNAHHRFILGGKSRVLNPDQRQQISALSSNSTKVTTISDAGHLIPMTHPFQLAQIILDMLLAMPSDSTILRGRSKL